MPSVDAIILNFKRRHNIGWIVRTCLACPEVRTVHVIDQADPEQLVRSMPGSRRVVYRREPNIGCGRRLIYGAELDCDLLLCIDDDVFLTTEQIGQLIGRAWEQPDRAHGIWGQDIVEGDGAIRIEGGVMNVDRPVGILNRVYAFAPEQARAARALATALGLDRDNLGPFDDVLLSFAAASPPLCHHLGPIRDCETSNQPGIAVWKEPGFDERRVALIEKIGAMLPNRRDHMAAAS